MAPHASNAESAAGTTRATSSSNANALKRDRRRRRSEIEQNSRLRQKRNFNYLVENILDRSLAELAASRFGPRELDSLIRQLKRCVNVFRAHAEDLAKNGRQTEITAPENNLILRKNEMALIAREILVNDHATQVLPRVTHSRCYTFLRAVFDSGTSDGRKKFRWDAAEEFVGLDIPLLRIWLDVITTHYLTCFMRTAPAYAQYVARLFAVAPSGTSPTSTPVPPSRVLNSSHHHHHQDQQASQQQSTLSHHHHHAADDDMGAMSSASSSSVRHLQTHSSDSTAFAHEGTGHHTSPAIGFCPPMVSSRNNSSGAPQPQQQQQQQQPATTTTYFVAPRTFGAWNDSQQQHHQPQQPQQPQQPLHIADFATMAAHGGVPRSPAEIFALMNNRQPQHQQQPSHLVHDPRSMLPIEDMQALATWLYGSPAAAAAANAAAANHSARIRDILN